MNAIVAAGLHVFVRLARRRKGGALRQRRARSLGLGLVLLGSLSLSGCAWLEAQQNQIALRPTPGRPAAFAVDGVGLLPGDVRFLVPVPLPVPVPSRLHGAIPDQLALWWLPHADPQAPTLLYLHGTFRNLYQNLSKINALREAGFAVLAVDYRGWGDSTPITPTEASINADAQQALAELQRRQPDAARRVIYGHSMGGAVAVTLAAGLRYPQDYGALVLESTFTRLPDVAAEVGFWGRVAAAFTTLDFNSAAKIARVKAPILMLHGSADTTVPVVLGRRLRDAAPAGTRWVEVPGGMHSTLHTQAPAVYQQAFADLIQQLPPPITKTANVPP